MSRYECCVKIITIAILFIIIFSYILISLLGAFFLSFMLPKNSILQDGINTWIGRMTQAGLTMLWKKQTIQTLVLQQKAKQKKRIAEKKTIDFVPFNLSDVQSSFYMLMIGLSVSAIVFLHEKGWLGNRSLSRTERSNSGFTI